MHERIGSTSRRRCASDRVEGSASGNTSGRSTSELALGSQAVAGRPEPAKARKDPKEILYPEVKVGGFTRVDGTIEFYNRVNALLSPHMTVLDFGAGRGAAAQDPVPYRRALSTLRGKVHEVIGVDLDGAVLKNPLVDRSIVIESGRPIPLGDRSIDLIVADSVFEHVTEPTTVVREFNRLLTVPGWVCARTPNGRGYVALAAKLLPERFHAGVLRWAQPQRKAEDVFSTVYRMNTPRDLRTYFDDKIWNCCCYGYGGEPSYFANSGFLARLMCHAHSLMPETLEPTLFFFAEKRADASI